MPLTPYVENKILSQITGQGSPLTVNQAWLGLASSEPSFSGNSVLSTYELSTTVGYSRILVGQSGTPVTYGFGTPSIGEIYNSKQLKFDMADPDGAGWGTATHALIFDASTGGNLLAYGQLVDPSDHSTPLSLSIGAGEVAVAPVSAVHISFN